MSIKKIDVHAHILPENMPNLKEKYGYGDEFIYLDHFQPGRANMMKADGTFFRTIDELCWNPASIIDHMDKHNVELMALSIVPVLFYYWAKPEHTLEWAKYFLPWLVGMPAETSLAICSMMFGGIFDKYPKLRVLFAHGGGCFPQTIGRISHAYHARPDLCNVHKVDDPRTYTDKFYIDSLVHDDATFEFLLNMFGPDKIAMGSDFPFPLGDLEHGRFIEQMKTLDEESKIKLLRNTAKNWLGI
jgi:predicted TIM-barrel fold metal-dependent hydrolase